MINTDNLDDFTCAYIECALWSTNGEDGEPLDSLYDITDISDNTLKAMIADCKLFQTINANLLAEAYAHKDYYSEQFTSQTKAGHDFWFTRNHHGAGFWDRGLGDIGDKLTALCGYEGIYKPVDLYVGDNGQVYHA